MELIIFVLDIGVNDVAILAQLRKPAFKVVQSTLLPFYKQSKELGEIVVRNSTPHPTNLTRRCNQQLLNLGQRYIFTDNYFLAYVIRKSSPSPPLLNTFCDSVNVGPVCSHHLSIRSSSSPRAFIYLFIHGTCVFLLWFLLIANVTAIISRTLNIAIIFKRVEMFSII